MDVYFSSHFLRSIKKLNRKEQEIISSRVEWFRVDPFDSRLKTHPLTGKLQGTWAFSISHSMRVTFVFPKKTAALLLDIGTHDELYRN